MATIIHERDLAKLTGYESATLRKLALDGHLPKPVRCQYPQTETIIALFKYLREHKGGKAEKRHTYPSMGACEGATGIPRSLQQSAKASGSDAFDAFGRIELFGLLRWIFSSGAINGKKSQNDEREARIKKLEADIRLADQEYSKNAEILCDVEEVKVALLEVLQSLKRSCFKLARENELNPQMENIWTEFNHSICETLKPKKSQQQLK